jgi:hypothetical protein
MQAKTFVLCLMLTFGLIAAAADEPVAVRTLEEGAAQPAATMHDLSWLVGRWAGTGLGGTAEDIIAPASGGQMMGMFRSSKADGSVSFYEFYVFAEKAGSLTLRLKHFSPMLASWEEKEEFVEFPLVAIEQHAAYFDGLTYRLEEGGKMTVGVRVGEDQIAYFDYRRAE